MPDDDALPPPAAAPGAVPPPDAVTPVAAPAAPAGRRERLVEQLHGVPLGARMVAILCLVLLLGLTATGATALTLLRRNLVEQVDAQIRTYAQPLLREAVGFGGRRGPWGDDDSGRLPSDYYVEFVLPDGSRLGEPVTADTSDAGTPRLPVLTESEVRARGQQPFTVASTEGSAGWRTIVLPAADDRGRYGGAVAIALPLTGVEETLDDMRTVIVLTGLAVITLGSVAGWVAVRRSLRPLQEMESTAAAIAAGDLTRRVPPGPSSTEVGRLGGALNSMLGQIERAFSARAASEDRMRRFVADASHELRTPLATIRGYSELYRMGALTTPEQVGETVRRIEDSATRMGRLVEDLLHLARLDEGRPLRAEPVDLTVLAADAVSDLRALDPGRPVRLAPLDDGGRLAPCVVVGDEDRLRQVLANLTGNVAAHTPPGTPVEVAVGQHVGQHGGRAVLEVRDHGPGIAPEHAARVFERFYRVDTSRTRESGGGAGLGMAIVAAIAGAHHGTVRIDATPGGGTTVRVELPSAPHAGDAADGPVAPGETATGGAVVSRDATGGTVASGA